ncbi:MAG: transglutaminase family protein [Myxococcota bacterium]|nr:transglutaminase family protein [Myxococcota bacterium]
MTIRVALQHVSEYQYDRPITASPHVVRLRPAPHCRTPIVAYSLRVQPESHFVNWQQDPFGNYEARLVFQKPARELTFVVDLVAEMTVVNPFDFFLEKDAEHFPVTYAPSLKRDLTPYLQTASYGPKFGEFVEQARSQLARAGRRIVDVLVDLNQRVQRSVHYDIRIEPGVFLPEETLARGHGSCRDFAWLLVQTLRQLGLAARFVSGYSIQLRADERPIEGPAGVENDSADLHAWAEVFLPGAGWVGLDPTSGLLAGEGHIPLACTPDPETAAPISGTYSWRKANEQDQIDEKFSFSMSVKRIYETPRVTRPYSDEAWNAILALGQTVDQALSAGDVRLTMGGEPTFVAAADQEAGEWNFTALGPTKRRYASELLHRLRDKFAPNGLVHEGQGKWYPGEPLPRWALSCYFRKDGQPAWRNPKLFARREIGNNSAADALAFIGALCDELEVDRDFAMPAYEDTWYYLWRERRLPSNVDPHDCKLEDEVERKRLARVFEQSLAAVVGYALPLRRSTTASQSWETGGWFLRTERLYLTPGDSPMGYRLPLDSLPWAPPGDIVQITPRDPFDTREPLKRIGPKTPAETGAGEPRFWPHHGSSRPETVTAPGSARRSGADPEPGAPARLASAAGIVRTTLCVEPRDGVLHVFLPPVARVEEYLELCAAIEATAEKLGMTLRLEGYAPPPDSRLGHFQITPDPGVIEVNIQPASDWGSLVDTTTALYREARNTELRAEKFMLDGRHTGTGGGNHVVLGGATPADSPLLRRPDLLRSLVGYWINHPSLSYLFSGMFVGPTSQAPRVDEARNDSLYELGIAFGLLDEEKQSRREAPPWLVDRLFRNLLIDVTGNTHRAEFCIDKLYSPDSPSGRQGLLELRAFEMPPHERMSLAQQLLVRALVAQFWRTPYVEPAVSWGTELHDRFLLPHFVWCDFEDVLEDLQRGGFHFDSSWFAPHFEFRFPIHGTIQARGGPVLELRQAIEPWHVLGEELAASGTSRYVDSSLERVEVKVRGMVEGRHVVACNGRRVPLHPTGTTGERVAGVRYRAWQPPSALHPTIGVHTPLVFDVIDSWNDRAIAGCTYHVSHPGGLASENFPRNGFEAQARRASRFWAFGHTPGKQAAPPPEPNPQFPFTLDLRRKPR